MVLRGMYVMQDPLPRWVYRVEGAELAAVYCDCPAWQHFAMDEHSDLEMGWIGVTSLFGANPTVGGCRDEVCPTATVTTAAVCQELVAEEAKTACQECLQAGKHFDCAFSVANKLKHCLDLTTPPAEQAGELEPCPQGLECTQGAALRGWATHCLGGAGEHEYCCPTTRTLNAAKTACVLRDIGAEGLPLCDQDAAGDGLQCTSDRRPSGYEKTCINLVGNGMWCCAAGKVLSDDKSRCLDPAAPVDTLPDGAHSCVDDQACASRCSSTGGTADYVVTRTPRRACTCPATYTFEIGQGCIHPSCASVTPPPPIGFSTGNTCTHCLRASGTWSNSTCNCGANKTWDNTNLRCTDPAPGGGETLPTCPSGLHCTSQRQPTGWDRHCQDAAWGTEYHCCPSGKVLNDARDACINPPADTDELVACGHGLYCVRTQPTGSAHQCIWAGTPGWCCDLGKVLNDAKTACVNPPSAQVYDPTKCSSIPHSNCMQLNVCGVSRSHCNAQPVSGTASINLSLGFVDFADGVHCCRLDWREPNNVKWSGLGPAWAN